MNLIFFRISAYIAIFAAYIVFMHSYAPLGIYWQDYHAQRIYNAVEFLKLNGYLSHYGYTIWDYCTDCSLEASGWQGRIYFSANAIIFFPYIILNHFGGKESLLLLGPLFDKFLILLCGSLLAELFIKSTKNLVDVSPFLIGIASFILFIFAPWTYQMIIAMWYEVYFLIFFLIGILAFLKNKTSWGYLAFFLAGLFHYQWAIAVGAFYCLLEAVKYFYIKNAHIEKFFPPFHGSQIQRIKVASFLIIPTFIIISMRLFAQQYIEAGTGSSLLFRMGISGIDIHNGGLLGALQFLGGIRVTQCFQGIGIEAFSGDLNMKMAVFNCLLSWIGMAIISVISIFGCYLFIKQSNLGKQILLPLLFAMILFIAVLQQSLSVHLMGYSFIFSALFSAGIIMLMISIHNRLTSPVLGLIFAIPCLIGVSLLSIRVSMLF